MKNKIFPTIEENFTILLRAGAFNITGTQLQPMSSFKWRKLQDLAYKLGVAGIISTGSKILEKDKNISHNIINYIPEENFNTSEVELYSFFKSKLFKKICDEEIHSIDTSTETLELLKLIIANINHIITRDLSLIGVITLGRFFKTKGHLVDFVKLENWIKELGIMQMMSYLASLLIELFDFEIQEFDFLKRLYTNPKKHYRNLINSEFPEKHQFIVISKLNLALAETICYHLKNIKKRISDIEDE